jgi:hypothetical protein
MLKGVKKLPHDVIINHIIPYTYQTQPLSLLRDIRSYTREFRFVKDVYYTEYNPSVLLCDLIRFSNNDGVAPIYGIEYKYELLLRRNYVLSSKCKTDIIQYVFQNIHDKLHHKTENKIKFLWGLLTSQERLNFIDEYILL